MLQRQLEALRDVNGIGQTGPWLILKRSGLFSNKGWAMCVGTVCKTGVAPRECDPKIRFVWMEGGLCLNGMEISGKRQQALQAGRICMTNVCGVWGLMLPAF